MKTSAHSHHVATILQRLATVFEDNKTYLNELDMKLGDGDHGLSMARGFAAAARHASRNPQLSIAGLLSEGAMQFNEAAGSTIGILMFSAMREAAQALSNKDELCLADLRQALDAAIRGIMKRGKAQLGQKTILDSLHPALQALQREGADSLADIQAMIRRTIEAAHEGAEHTRQLTPGVGRARWFAARSAGEIDPGAFSGYLLIKTIGEYLSEKVEG